MYKFCNYKIWNYKFFTELGNPIHRPEIFPGAWQNWMCCMYPRSSYMASFLPASAPYYSLCTPWVQPYLARWRHILAVHMYCSSGNRTEMLRRIAEYTADGRMLALLEVRAYIHSNGGIYSTVEWRSLLLEWGIFNLMEEYSVVRRNIH